MTEILCADCVGKSYRGRKILSSASLRAVSGELRALLGRNGAGKSTLLRIAAGLVPPDTGHVRWEGEAFTRAADHVTWCVSGTTYELGAPEAAAENERFRREYLGTKLVRG